jgi:hypothetical protein
MNVANVYFPELPVRHVDFNEGDSDHTSFNNHGYMGIYPFEDYQNYSPYIHTTSDLIGTSVNSFEMSQQYCRMNIGCLSELATLVDHSSVSEIDDPDDEVVYYEVFDLMGRMVYSTDLESGIYMMRFFKKNGGVVTKKIVK